MAENPHRPARRESRIWWLAAMLLCAMLLGLRPVYETDDDPAMIGLLSGRAYGQAFDTVFLGRPVIRLLMTAYHQWPDTPWYGLLMQGFNLLSAGLWIGLILKRVRAPLHRVMALAGLVAMQYPLLRLNFMGTALGLYLAALAWGIHWQAVRAPFRPWHAGAGLLMGIAFMIRPYLGHLMLFCAVPMALLSRGRPNFKRLAWMALAAAALAAWTVQDAARAETEADRAYWEFNSVRSAFFDKPHVVSPQALAAAGWSRRDYEAAWNMWLHDEQLFSPERLRDFLNQARLEPGLVDYARQAWTHLSRRHHLLMLLVLATVIGFLWFDGRRSIESDHAQPPRWVARVSWLWLLAGWLALVAVRLPARAYVPLYLFLGVLTAILPPGRVRPRLSPALRRGLRPAAGGVALALAAISVGQLWRTSVTAGRAERARQQDFVANVARLNGDEWIVPISPLYSDQYTPVFCPLAAPAPGRLISSGWVLRSPAYRHVLSSAGFAGGRDLLQRAIDHPGVVFVVRRDDPARIQLWRRHLQDHYADGRTLEILPDSRPDPKSAFLFFRVATRTNP